MIAALIRFIQFLPRLIQFLIMLLELFPHVAKLWRTWEQVKTEKLTRVKRRDLVEGIATGIEQATTTKDTSQLEQMLKTFSGGES